VGAAMIVFYLVYFALILYCLLKAMAKEGFTSFIYYLVLAAIALIGGGLLVAFNNP
jgi:hypothetical protein